MLGRNGLPLVSLSDWGEYGLGLNTAVNLKGMTAGNCQGIALLTAVSLSGAPPWLLQWMWDSVGEKYK